MERSCIHCGRTFRTKRNVFECGDCALRKAQGRLTLARTARGGESIPTLSRFGPKPSSREDLPPLMNAASFVAKYPKPADFTITGASERKIKGEPALVLSFRETEMQLVVNATNAQALANKFGDVELSALVGQTITLAVVPTTYEGKNVNGIRVV